MEAALAGDAHRSFLGRVDVVLGAFDAEHPSLTLRGIVARTGLPKTTVFRVTSQLIQLGWMDHQGDRYVVGNRLFELGSPVWIRTRLRERALPFMQDLYETTHETVHLAVLSQRNVLFVEKLTGHRAAACPSRVGERMPPHCTALGKVLLAHTPAVMEQVVADGLRPRTPATIVSANRLRNEVSQVKEERVGYDREECVPGLACVAAPILGPDGTCVAAMSLTVPTNRLQPTSMRPAIWAAASGISRVLTRPAPRKPDPGKTRSVG